MSYKKFSDELEKKIESLGVVILQKKIEDKDGFYEAGSRCIIGLESYDKDESTCTLRIYDYNGGCDEHKITIAADKIDDYFMPDTKLKTLESIYSEIIEKKRKITDVLLNIVLINFIILTAIGILYGIIKITGERGFSLVPLILKISAALFISALIIWLLFDSCYLLKQRKKASKNIDDYLNSDIAPKDIQNDFKVDDRS